MNPRDPPVSTFLELGLQTCTMWAVEIELTHLCHPLSQRASAHQHGVSSHRTSSILATRGLHSFGISLLSWSSGQKVVGASLFPRLHLHPQSSKHFLLSVPRPLPPQASRVSTPVAQQPPDTLASLKFSSCLSRFEHFLCGGPT